MIHDYLVIGAGISGTSAAYELAALGSVLVLEAEAAPGYHATGRSAALFTPHYGGPVVRKINALSQPVFLAPPPELTDRTLLRRRGALTVFAPDSQVDRAGILASSTSANPVEDIGIAETLEMVPFLRRERTGSALIEPGVADIDVSTLHQSYLRGLKARGGAIQTKAAVTNLAREGDLWTVRTATDSHRARVVINAAGAWAEQVGKMAGAQPIGLVPKRRTAILIDPPDGIDPQDLPVIDFADVPAYIKPDAAQLMASPGDATPMPPQDVQPEELDVATLADWLERETRLQVRRIPQRWAGLRSFVQDEAPVVGFDPARQGFFWLAGQGGFGIMMAPALAQIACALCTGSDLPPAMRAVGLDLRDIAPERLAAG